MCTYPFSRVLLRWGKSAGENAMGKRVDLQGRYRILDEAYLRAKANDAKDPRHIFYVAMLSNNRYEEYLAQVGEKAFKIPTYRDGPNSGRMEIFYARRNRRIADA